MMELTFAHLQRRAEAGQGGAAWDTLLGAFERCVLLTHRSKFTQVGPAGSGGRGARPPRSALEGTERKMLP